MSLTLNITTGGLTKIGKRFTYHIWDEKDIKRVTNRLKKIVKKYPHKRDLYGVGQTVTFYADTDHGALEGSFDNTKDVDDLMHDIKHIYLKRMKA
jgi:hypothetical protein